MRNHPPAQDEFELSIIGPGRGETIVIHLGDNEWAVVDSCIAKGSKTAAAVEYLDTLGVGSTERIRLVVATHWHDDHIRGLSGVLKRAANARFGCSVALKEDEFLTLVGLAAESIDGIEGVAELTAILEQLSSRQADGQPPQLVTPQYAIENRELLNLNDPGRAFPLKIRALSPSDATVHLALQDIAALIPREGDPPNGIPSSASANHSSVVLWVEAAQHRILLGADLEHVADQVRVVRRDSGPRRSGVGWSPEGPSHHGSEGADCPDMWERMLAPQLCLALLAPFNGGKWLPSRKDQDRLSLRTPMPTALWLKVAPHRSEKGSLKRKLRGSRSHERLLVSLATFV